MSPWGKALTACALILVLSTAPVSVSEGRPPIPIGASLAQTGIYAVPGLNQLRGYKLCVRHINERGGVLGRKLELIVYDDASDAARAVRLYEKLITQDKVSLVLGPYSSPISDAVADVSEKYQMPMVAPIAAATAIYRKGRKFVFSMLPPGGALARRTPRAGRPAGAQERGRGQRG